MHKFAQWEEMVLVVAVGRIAAARIVLEARENFVWGTSVHTFMFMILAM
jgi:hypothetical protein